LQDIVLAVMLLFCLLTDLRERKIYNVVILPVLFFGLAFNLFTDGWSGLVHSLAGCLIGLGILIIPFAFGGMGAGDVKLLAVIGAVKGPVFILYTALGMAIAGGIIALGVLIYQRQLVSLALRLIGGLNLLVGTRFQVVAFDLNRKKIMFPYGLAIVAGAAGAFWWMG
jgi:prepilin peptidase CpaA